MKSIPGILAFASLLWAATLSAGTAFYVAPDGNDAWSGSLAKPDAAKSDGPFASPAKAKAAAREAKAKGLKGPFSVEIRGGLYQLPETLAFTEEDSGSEQEPVLWKAFGDEKPLLSGGRLIAGFKESVKDGKRVWTVEIPEAKDGKWSFRELFVSKGGGPFERRYRPQLGMKSIEKLTYSPCRGFPQQKQGPQKDFVYRPGDIKAWDNVKDVEIVLMHMWSSSRMPVERVDEAKRIVEMGGMPGYAFKQAGPLMLYFVENVKDALSSPGQWYLDRAAGTLSYLPLEGETLSNARVIAPALPHVLSITGDYEKGSFASFLKFQGLSFAHCEAPLPRGGWGGQQSQPTLPAAIELTGAKGCEFLRCSVSGVGEYAIGIGLGSQGNRVKGCLLYDLGGGGVKIGDLKMDSSAKPPKAPSGNSVEDCLIGRGGIIHFASNGVWGGIVEGATIRNNEIFEFPYSGIAVGWSWNDKPTACGKNRIELNRIHNVMTLLSDGAGIYTLGRQPGTVISGNVIYDNVKSVFAPEHWQLGIYLDEGSSEMLVEKNLDYRVGTHGFNMNGCAQNTVRNNLFGPVYGNHGPYIRCFGRSDAKGNVFARNVSYCDSPNLADAVWSKELMDCHDNLYFNFAGLPLLFKTKSFEEWQAGGQDKGSINADPLIENFAKDDFRLKPESPAFKLGFEAFDPSLAGPSGEFKGLKLPPEGLRPPVFSMTLPPPVNEGPDISLDFEDVPTGLTPVDFSAYVVKGEEGDAQVVEEASKSGAKSLKIAHRKNAPKPYMPHLVYSFAKPVASGEISLSCEILQAKEAPSAITVEFRDYKTAKGAKEFATSPSVTFKRDGSIEASGKPFAKAKPGEWTRLEISFSLGAKDRREALVKTVSASGEKAETRLPLDEGFQAAESLFLISGGDADGRCYVDDLKLSVAK